MNPVAIVLLLAMPVILLLMAYHGVALWLLWGWFLVPLGLPPISITWAMGISCTAAMLHGTPAPAPEGKGLTHFQSMLLRPAVAVLFGYAIKQLGGF